MKIKINTEYIKLDSALKYCGLAESGVFAKEIIKNGEVKVNGETEMRRGKKLYKNDKFEFNGEVYEIE